MVSRDTFTEPGRQAAFTLVEVMVASAIGLLTISVVALLSFFSSRSFVAMTNYTDLGLASQLALDKMSREIRQAQHLTAYTNNSITFLDATGTNSVQFVYDAGGRTLSRVSGGQTSVYLNDCDSLQFWIYQHTPMSNTFNCYSSASVANARLVEVTWSCSRQILGTPASTESMQSSKIAIRNH